MNIAVVGDSSVACIREALAADPSLGRGNTLTFFAGPSKTMEGFRIDGNSLVADNDRLRGFINTTSCGKARLAVAEFDVFVTVGLGLDLRPVPDRTYSAAVLEAAYRGLTHNSLAWSIIGRIRRLSQAPIYCVAAPLKALTSKRFSELYPDPSIPYNSMVDGYKQVLRDCGARLVAQPASTRNGDLRTRTELTRGSIRLIQGTPHPAEDITHMNANYGSAMLAELINDIERNSAAFTTVRKLS